MSALAPPLLNSSVLAIEFQRAREAYETLADPERRRRYDRQLRVSRAQPVVMTEVIVTRPFPEPLFPSHRDYLASRIQVTATQSIFDRIVEQFFASFDEDLFWRHVVGGNGGPWPTARRSLSNH